MTGKEISKWSDKAMFKAEPVAAEDGPKVYLLEMTSDPLGSIAALSAMYTGKVTRSKEDVNDEERAHHLSEMQKTKLTTPLEAVKLHFMIEGVTRAFTHQLVRNRTSAYAQESMRFAVKEDMPVALPPSLQGTMSEIEWKAAALSDYGYDADLAPAFDRESDLQKQRIIWDETVEEIRCAYNALVGMGMPAEEARGLAPTNVLTRINWVTDLRTLLDVAGVRLCTQAQFEWRAVFGQIVQAIRENYKQDRRWIHLAEVGDDSPDSDKKDWLQRIQAVEAEYGAISNLMRPICYKTGKCEFMSDADRACSIRDRVQANHSIGRKSSEWGKDLPESGDSETPFTMGGISAIHPAEWLLDHAAARVR
jgi:flavin-dependent thymidylate synthase